MEPIAYDMYTTLPDYARQASRDYSWQGDIPGVKEVSVQRVGAFECPSDNINEDNNLTVMIASQPLMSDDDNDIGTHVWPEEDNVHVKATNYVACGGITGNFSTPERNRWRGCMTSRNRVTLETVMDGTSRTVMYAESIGGIKDSQRSSAYSWFSAGFARGRGDIPYLQPRDNANPELRILGDAKNSSVYGFGSKHPDGVMMGFADGAVRFFSRDANWETMYQVCGARDGGTPNLELSLAEMPQGVTSSAGRRDDDSSQRAIRISDRQFAEINPQDQLLHLRRDIRRIEDKVDKLQELVEKLLEERSNNRGAPQVDR